MQVIKTGNRMILLSHKEAEELREWLDAINNSAARIQPEEDRTLLIELLEKL